MVLVYEEDGRPVRLGGIGPVYISVSASASSASCLASQSLPRKAQQAATPEESNQRTTTADSTMKPQALLSAAAFLPAFAAAAPSAEKRDGKPVAFLLAGDSTTAVQSAGGGGWGTGFINLIKKPAFGTNYGVNGRTTADYVSLGYWETVKEAVKANTAKYDVYVTAQFGHNDQKVEKNISLDQYQENLANFARDIKAIGGSLLLITPLTRRTFNAAGILGDSLADQRLRTIAAAMETGTTYLDLNLYSRKYVQAIGPEKAHSYNLHPDDTTHLNGYGSTVFGELVADLLLRKEPALEQWFTPNKTLSDEIWKAINSSTA
ncbi:GDSL-like Lipase/Acylhydrolase [Colletotrichum orchidophilum]|uniref:GDSL-like Lipase/Acylhydrolase n=1 Tax=Colletotrichum orchidophilum TaxID=1209926 RepID=A0A1G4BKD5_9PEZI|nr:GDSL-like Lipase/Acylhydrolase [Colletotrichum orchidophilum]OHF01763.1 GDSL-like Lipase/Acylhydrolase [Colletotrichum orchidophilum]